MKKLTGMILAAAAVLSFGVPFISASAADDITVNVTISNAGTLVVTAKDVKVADRNGDGKYDIDEALYAAHEACYDGGAAAGYASAKSDWGLSITTLWGVSNGGGFGYYADDQFAMNLSDPVKDGGTLNAFVYSDLKNWSDSYSYFDQREISDAKQGDEKTLKLSKFVFGADGAAKAVPAAGAVITINGEKTEFKTDDNGEVKVKLDKAGDLLISAVSDTDTLVPPVLHATVAAAETTTADITTTAADVTTTASAAAVTTTSTKAAAAVTTTVKASGSSTSAAKTGDTAAIPALALTAALACGAAYALRRRND